MDYLENFCKVRLEQENFHPEVLEQYRKEYFQTTETNKQISAAATLTKDDSKSELNRRREARHKKEEDKRAMAMKREEEQKRIEQARKEEEKRKMEERKKIAARRREEELLKLEEEREALERRRTEMKKKAEEKLQTGEKKQHKAEENNKLLQSIEEEFAAAKKPEDMDHILKEMDEIAAEKDITLKAMTEKEAPPEAAAAKPRGMSAQEEKLIEDILKEFFA
jgi:hypothetical protein